MSEQLTRFISLLEGIFELDKSDLDFGIYRIINIRRKEIERFLKVDLPKRVQETLAPFAADTAGAEKRLKDIEAQLGGSESIAALPQNLPMVQEYHKLKSTLAKGLDLSGLEADVYSHLYSFFNRYYEEGDFISKRRYKEGVYAIPYEGEEVKLYWANQDQYYIKTSENFKDYVFNADGYTIHFKLVDATTEQDNNKESKDNKRVFMLYTENPEQPELKTFEFDAEKKELIIRFIFDIPEDKKTKYKELNADTIKQWIATKCPQLVKALLADISSDPKKPLTLIEKHLNAYVAKNTFDYFIHKDLHKFLSRELDFYIKNEVMHLDDIDTQNEQRVETYLAMVRAIKRVGAILIDFLSSIEDFQKKLWLKKKFVVQCDYCITLDRIPEEFYPEIWTNEDQLKEWERLGFISDLHHDYGAWEFTYNDRGYLIWNNGKEFKIKTDHAGKKVKSLTDDSPLPKTANIKDTFPTLVIDTVFFSEDFKSRFLACIDGFDKHCNGLLLHSENFQALAFLKSRFSKMVDYIYIDPPYNTDSAPILYKNGYKDSSWISLINDRVIASQAFLTNSGVFTVAIDDTELHQLFFTLKQSFNYSRISQITIVHNPKGSPTKDFNRTHEYALFITKEDAKNCIARTMEENDTPRKMRRWGENSLRTERPLSFYPIFIKNNKIIRIGSVPDDNYHPAGKNEIQKDGSIAVWPIDKNGVERRWNFGLDSIKDNLDRVTIIEDEGVYDLFLTHEKTIPKTVWKGGEYDAGSYGNSLLIDILGEKKFDFPKSINTMIKCVNLATAEKKNSIVLDFFAGSGSTGHAVLSLNKKDQGERKYILVEMGNYFHEVTKPRIEKIIFSADWKAGKPVNVTSGVSHCFKYMRLESYEDALSNVVLPKTETSDTLFKRFGDEYLVKYMLDLNAAGSVLNLDDFREPFQYKLKVTEKNETKEVNADLVETFNYLIGLTVERMYARRIFSASADPNGEYEGAVKLRIDNNGDYVFRQVEGKLPDGRRALIIWRNITDNLIASNAALDAYFQRYRINPADREFDVIYVNGDNNLENLKNDNEAWKVRMIEPEFKRLMFEEE